MKRCAAAELRTHFARVSESLDWSLHYIVNGDISVGDDLSTGSSTWYLWQPMTTNGVAVWTMGRYRERHGGRVDHELVVAHVIHEAVVKQGLVEDVVEGLLQLHRVHELVLRGRGDR